MSYRQVIQELNCFVANVYFEIVSTKIIYDTPSDNSVHNSQHGASNHNDNMSVFMDHTMRIKLMAQTIHTTFKLNRLYGNAYTFGQDEMKKYAKRQYQIIFFFADCKINLLGYAYNIFLLIRVRHFYCHSWKGCYRNKNDLIEYVLVSITVLLLWRFNN